jgi:hypothetical protein
VTILLEYILESFHDFLHDMVIYYNSEYHSLNLNGLENLELINLKNKALIFFCFSISAFLFLPYFVPFH